MLHYNDFSIIIIVVQQIETYGGEKIMNTNLERYMKFSEAMKYLNLKSYQSLHKFIDDGLRVVSVGDTKRIDQRDADKFMEDHKSKEETK